MTPPIHSQEGGGRLTAALRTARRVIAEERDVLINSCTVSGDLATMDPDAAPCLAKYDAALAEIDAALQPGAAT